MGYINVSNAGWILINYKNQFLFVSSILIHEGDSMKILFAIPIMVFSSFLLAGEGWYTDIRNNTEYKISIDGGYNLSCWDPYDYSGAQLMQPNSQSRNYTEMASSLGCFFDENKQMHTNFRVLGNNDEIIKIINIQYKYDSPTCRILADGKALFATACSAGFAGTMNSTVSIDKKGGNIVLSGSGWWDNPKEQLQ